MAHTISCKIVKTEGDSAHLVLSGMTDSVHGFQRRIGELLNSLPYLIDMGYRQSIADAGALPKGTPDADRRAARRERDEKLVAGFTGGTGGSRLPLWVRLARESVSAYAPVGLKAADVASALFRDDLPKVAAAWAKARGLDAAKVAARLAKDVAAAKREAARREALDSQDIDLDDLR